MSWTFPGNLCPFAPGTPLANLPPMNPPPYDVLIVGGRPAGASLAIRLGRLGHRVLLLERANLPSPPNVPSCPTLHMGALAILDELGLPEQSYAAGAVRVDHFVIEFGGYFTAWLEVPEVHGRSYELSIDRAVFDDALLRLACQTPNVEVRRFSVKRALLEDGVAVGVEGNAPDGPSETLHARWIVGADGRFSGLARDLGSKVVEEVTDTVSTLYFTDWEGVTPPDPGRPHAVAVYTTGRGRNVLFFPLPGGRTTVCLHERADRVQTDGDPGAYYRGVLESMPGIAPRLREARMVGKLLGLKRVGNGYREAAGPGWALAGDAYHYKDPVDGQGIYDALLGTRILAEELHAQLSGQKDAASAARDYSARVHAATHPMFLATVKRLQTELYSEPPVPVIRTLLRWMLQDREYHVRFMRFLGRDIEPEGWLPLRFVLGAWGRGLWRDLRGWFGAVSG